MGGGGIGPQIPPEVAARLGICVDSGGVTEREREAEQTNSKRSVIGPSMPPPPSLSDADSPTKASVDDNAESSEDSEAVGPSTELAGYSKKQARQQTMDKLDAQMEQNSSSGGGGGKTNKHDTREEWMLVPPSKRGASGQPTDDSIFDESWTLTPEQRRKQAAQQTKAAKTQHPKETAASRRKQEEDQDRAQWVDEFNRTQRPKSLMEMHLETKHKSRRSKRSHNKNSRPQEQDDSWKRQRFDRNRDLTTEKKSGRSQQHAVLDAMGTLNDKYAPGKSGSFL
ncbi:hypothetical protein COEREDRAFT_8707 [Coemansia reversa NRRL 1564]|uniref:DUF3752 domain-containing protein n=1 Tax=Coemansia reversa (strain ATCC 12441 / NRRL 1564) TaxID=763665 RepID=A0A2G5BAK9_COERN|nr:hypothetical protein COEREDRAFT_8707 [Coemansia reversa NRRL 1564]|eukprot:PIA16044.1 hypothetical protein COEREDRAFT_8707 [Coemansia reversa NRRL 1564]